jgi:sec-independent protein translocase protein TatA
MFGLGMQELLIILVIALVIFGPGKLPQIGSGLGKAIRDFKKGVSDEDAEEKPKQEDSLKEEETRKIPR